MAVERGMFHPRCGEPFARSRARCSGAIIGDKRCKRVIHNAGKYQLSAWSNKAFIALSGCILLNLCTNRFLLVNHVLNLAHLLAPDSLSYAELKSPRSHQRESSEDSLLFNLTLSRKASSTVLLRYFSCCLTNHARAGFSLALLPAWSSVLLI